MKFVMQGGFRHVVLHGSGFVPGGPIIFLNPRTGDNWVATSTECVLQHGADIPG